MKLHHTKYKANYKRYILDTIDIDGNELATDQEKINYLFNRFYSEYGHAIERYGKYKAMSEWLSGLALDLPYIYGDIIEMSVEMGSIEEEPSEKLQSKVINNYWVFMANIILGLEPKD
tara:strand:+ start:1755 stop:2108 length:354 start_codon:yes stop_codon:yes gene_type:complete